MDKLKIAQSQNTLLIDMDDSLCDFMGKLRGDMRKLAPKDEPEYKGDLFNNVPEYIGRRKELIISSQEWWVNLPKLQLGFDVLKVAQELDYRIMILTQGPKKYPSAWSGKKIWVERNIGTDIDITITRDKGLVYGKVFVDDYPRYLEGWLAHRPRGLAIMPVNDTNKDYTNPQVIKYDGTNITEVRHAMTMRLRPDWNIDMLRRV